MGPGRGSREGFPGPRSAARGFRDVASLIAKTRSCAPLDARFCKGEIGDFATVRLGRTYLWCAYGPGNPSREPLWRPLPRMGRWGPRQSLGDGGRWWLRPSASASFERAPRGGVAAFAGLTHGGLWVRAGAGCNSMTLTRGGLPLRSWRVGARRRWRGGGYWLGFAVAWGGVPVAARWCWRATFPSLPPFKWWSGALCHSERSAKRGVEESPSALAAETVSALPVLARDGLGLGFAVAWGGGAGCGPPVLARGRLLARLRRRLGRGAGCGPPALARGFLFFAAFQVVERSRLSS